MTTAFFALLAVFLFILGLFQAAGSTAAGVFFALVRIPTEPSKFEQVLPYVLFVLAGVSAVVCIWSIFW